MQRHSPGLDTAALRRAASGAFERTLWGQVLGTRRRRRIRRPRGAPARDLEPDDPRAETARQRTAHPTAATGCGDRNVNRQRSTVEQAFPAAAHAAAGLDGTEPRWRQNSTPRCMRCVYRQRPSIHAANRSTFDAWPAGQARYRMQAWLQSQAERPPGTRGNSRELESNPLARRRHARLSDADTPSHRACDRTLPRGQHERKRRRFLGEPNLRTYRADFFLAIIFARHPLLACPRIDAVPV